MPFTSFAPTLVNPAAAAAIVYAATDAANGNTVVNNGKVEIRVKNPTGGAITVTIASVPDSNGRLGDIVQAIPAAGEFAFGLLDPSLFNQRTGDIGQVHVSFSGAGCTMAAVQLG